VNQFRYLGSILTEDGRFSSEIQLRAEKKTPSFNKRKKITNKELKYLTESAYHENNGVKCSPIWIRNLDFEENGH